MAIINSRGAEGERMAQEFLIKQGMIIRETNWRIGHLEVDIIAETPGRLHIVEVKSRKSDEQFDPLISINAKKRRNLVTAARAYVNYYRLNIDVQFDIILVIAGERIEYIPDAFFPPLKTYT